MADVPSAPTPTGASASDAHQVTSPLSRVKPPTGAPKGPIIGIDLGTTYSCVAAVKNGKPYVIPSREGHNTIPSIIALGPKHQLLVGHPAKSQLAINPKETVFGAKRLVGRPYVSDVVQLVKEHFQYEIVEGRDGESAVLLGGVLWSLQQISAMILVEARELASAALGVDVQRAVITVPAYYNEHQRQAVRAAGTLAGLHVERILNEPTAAALAFGYGRKLEKVVLVYDLGGGTFDASLLQLGDDVYEVLSTGGDTFLGGVDFDQRIADLLLAEARTGLRTAWEPDATARQRLVEAAESAKRLLSEQTSTRVQVPFLATIGGKPFDLDLQLTRAQIQDACAPLVERTVEVCREVLKAGGKEPADVAEVILVGGMSRMPLVHESINALVGKKPNSGVHPDEAVALGAALFAHSLGQEQGVTLIDVLPMTIGVGLPRGRLKPIIPRNTKLPHSKAYGLATVKDDQEELELAVYQGEGQETDEAEYLGTVKIAPLPKGAKGTVTLAVEFSLSAECLLTVTAREVSKGLEVKATFSTRDTPEVVKARLARAERIAAAVQKAKAAASAKTATAAKPAAGGFLSRLLERLFPAKR